MKTLFCVFAGPLCLISTVFAADYLPLAVGNVWNYAISRFGFTGTANLVVEQKVVNGADTLYRMSSKADVTGMDIDSSSMYMMSDGNDILTVNSLNETKPYDKGFEHHPVAGHAWSKSTGVNLKIVPFGSITVAAGTFNDCYALMVDGDTSEIYAPDVGIIANLAMGEIVLSLTSYTVAGTSPVLVPVQQAHGKPSFPETMPNPGRFMLVNIQGRCVDHAGPGRALAPGSYFLFDEKASASDVKSTIRMCVPARVF